MEKKKILFVSQELSPFVPKSDIATFTKRIPQSIQDAGKDIRVFTPKFGCINERRHQLHEVIRLSGMNIIIDDKDHPLLIKVASIPTVRLQVYFIDNEEFFERKSLLKDDNDELFKDNDERAMFFCRGVLETVKKLGWKPDVIFCHGEMTYFMPLYIKKIFHKDPHFNDSKVVLTLYNDENKPIWDNRLTEKLKFEGFDKKFLQEYQDISYNNIMKNIFKLSDGLIIGDPSLSEETLNLIQDAPCMKQEFILEENQSKTLSEFFDKVIEDKVLA
ncbi:MAG: glycogen/starch synthase [Flavobacteriia bacterium]|nr:glycogen/starch synthase [Flavobacteriia bacterium]